jgi:hypothetical protein
MYYIIAASGKKATTNAHNAASADWTASKKMWGDQSHARKWGIFASVMAFMKQCQ